MKIVLDTNFILICVKQKIDLFHQLRQYFPEYGILVPEKVLEELGSLSRSRELKLVEREFASIALQIVSKNKPEVLFGEGEADDIIVNHALSNKEDIIASLDKGLRKRIRGAKILTIMKKKIIGLA